MKNLPENWKLVEEYDGNFIFENEDEEFQVSIDNMGRMVPKFSICFQQLKGTFTRIGFEDGAYANHSNTEAEALDKAAKLMEFINQKILTKPFEKLSS